MNSDETQAEYVRLGYQSGWTFMMTREARLYDATVCLVGLNPGGRHLGPGIWSCEDGNTYHIQNWATRNGEAVHSPLQQQVHHLEQLLGLERDGYLAAQFIPFRSADWHRLNNEAQAWTSDEGCGLGS